MSYYNIDYNDVYVVDTFEEAEQFKYAHNDESVEVGTAVGCDVVKRCMKTNKVLRIDLTCFDGIYFDDQN